jgi:hypothetical protein
MSTLTEARGMPKQARIQRGLCVTCKNAPTCVFPRDPQRLLLECEEFDGLTMEPQKTAGPESGWTVLGKDQLLDKRLGLCANCEERGTCVFPKPERAVLQCEEYR